MTKNKRTFFILLAALFALLTYFHTVVKETIESEFSDFGHYWLCASLLREGYNVWDWNGQIQKKNIDIAKEQNLDPNLGSPPLHSLGYFVIMLPFSLLPFHLAVFLWSILGHILLFIFIWLILKICRIKPSLEDLCIVLFLVFSFWSIIEQLHMQQPNFLILFFLSLCISLMKKDRMLWAGIFLALAIQCREYLAVSVLFFLWNRNWRVLIGVILGTILLKGGAIFLFGWPREISYWHYIIKTFSKQAHATMFNVSFLASLYRIGNGLLSTPICFAMGLFIIAAFIISAFYYTRKKDTDSLLGFSLFLVLAFVVSPWVHEYHFLALYPVIIIIWFRLEEKNRANFYLIFILAYLLLGLKYSLIRFPQFHSGILAIFTAGKAIGIVVLYYLIVKLISIDLVNKNQSAE